MYKEMRATEPLSSASVLSTFISNTQSLAEASSISKRNHGTWKRVNSVHVLGFKHLAFMRILP